MSDGVFMHKVMNSDRAVGTGCHGYVPPSYCGAQTRQKSPPLNNVKKEPFLILWWSKSKQFNISDNYV